MRTFFIILLLISLVFIGFIFIKTIKSNNTTPSNNTSLDSQLSNVNKPTANLIFKSSFDEETFLSKPDRKDSEIWWQDIKNTKKNNNSKWPAQKGKGSLQMIVNKNNINDYIENKIETTIGINNTKTKALHQIIRKKEHEWTQVPYLIETDDKEQDQLYIRYSLKLPENLSEVLGKDGWLVLSEYKTVSDYRLALYVYADKKKNLYWYAHGDNVVLDDIPYKEYWYRENKKIPVPEGKWMDVEIFWKRSTGNDGRVWLTIDGETVIDYHGSTKLVDPIRIIMLYTNYASAPLDQWIDNVEVWDDFPCKTGKSCH
jgi:uncharacterized protein (UPF0216 family)